MYKSSLELIRHIEKETSYILEAINGVPGEVFYNDKTLTRAACRALEIIGEASKKVNDEFKSNHPEIEWKKIARMRDKLIHHYEGIDYEIIWKTIVEEIPELHFQVINILKNAPKEEE